MQDAKTVSTSLETNAKITKETSPRSEDEKRRKRRKEELTI